jgi:RecQ-mediated genome instability protein 1
MAIPPQLTAWLDEHYPSPRVDPEWLDACYTWVTTEHHLDPAADMPAIIEHVEAQLLQSDLCDSMSHGTGIPLALLTAVSGTLRGPVLVEITALTEVGSSALALDQVRVARAERFAAGAGLDDEENEADLEVDGEGPVPNYPRGMLRLELSDGATTLSAIEYRPLPELTLGVTPLGYKVFNFSQLYSRTDLFSDGLERRSRSPGHGVFRAGLRDPQRPPDGGSRRAAGG